MDELMKQYDDTYKQYMEAERKKIKLMWELERLDELIEQTEQNSMQGLTDTIE